MKLKLVSALILLLLPVFIFPLFSKSAFAQNKKEEKVVILENDKTLNEDYFASGDRVEVLGNVNGDVFVAGEQIIIEGNVAGDVFAAGGSIEIVGDVMEDIYAAGGQITIDGKVGGSVTIAGGNISFSNNASVGEDINVAGGNISIASPVGEDVRAGGGNVTLSNTVGRDVLAGAGALRLGKGASIGNALTYLSERKVSIANGATISGKTNYFAPQYDRGQPQKAAGTLAGGAIALMLANAFSTLVVGLIFINAFEKFADNRISAIKNNPWLTIIFGIIVLIIAPLLFVLVMATLVGIPLAIISFLAYLVVIYVSRIFAITLLGGYILKTLNNKKNLSWTFIVGLVTYYILGLVPIIGGITTFIAVILGLGTISRAFNPSSKTHKK